MTQEKSQRLFIAAMLTNAYQPSTTGLSAVDCENAKITQFERMYALVGLADTPDGEKVFPTPAAVPIAEHTISDPTQLQNLAKALAPLLAALNPIAGAAVSVLGNLPPIQLPSKAA